MNGESSSDQPWLASRSIPILQPIRKRHYSSFFQKLSSQRISCSQAQIRSLAMPFVHNRVYASIFLNNFVFGAHGPSFRLPFPLPFPFPSAFESIPKKKKKKKEGGNIRNRRNKDLLEFIIERRLNSNPGNNKFTFLGLIFAY